MVINSPLMKASPVIEILTIGREILDGRVIDTNSVHLALEIKKLGLVPRYAQKVDDDPERMTEAFKIASERSDIIFVTGGLGPTADDLTAEVFSQFLGEAAQKHPQAWEEVRDFFAKLGRPLTPVQEKQAFLPRSATVLKNREGSAPGFRVRSGRSTWYFMPGVPREMKSILTLEILPELPRQVHYHSHTWATQFTSEGELQSRLDGVQKQLAHGFELSFRTRFPENHIGLYGNLESEKAQNLYKKLSREISTVLGNDVFCEGEEAASLEKVVVDLLRSRGVTLATVESCTGGLVASRLTDVSGSSDIFHSGFVTYDNTAKVALGVEASLIEKHGAVSEVVARSMAEAGLKKLLDAGVESALCVSTTGVAGPGGGSQEKPVGLCFVGLSILHKGQQHTEAMEVRARSGLERSLNKLFFSQKALDFVRRKAMGWT